MEMGGDSSCLNLLLEDGVCMIMAMVTLLSIPVFLQNWGGGNVRIFYAQGEASLMLLPDFLIFLTLLSPII